MQVTSDTLFHFTTTLYNLQNILTKKFQLTYCHEQYRLDYETHDYYYPMISFCDIPLSLARDQIKRYGPYAIGLTKEWGIKNHLNPVVYIERDSLLTKDIQDGIDNINKLGAMMSSLLKEIGEANHPILSKSDDLVNEIVDFSKAISPNNKLSDKRVKKIKNQAGKYLSEVEIYSQILKENLSYIKQYGELSDQLKIFTYNHINLYRYIKNYTGPLTRNNKTKPNYRFYDEREWRFIPAIKDSRLKPWLTDEQFKEYRGSNKKKPFINGISLTFDSDDIKYLMVKSSKDISNLIKVIKSIDGLAKNSNDTDILTTKILTVEQINKDF